jgi:hypothetical protein
MRSLPAILLALAFLLLGTGALEYIHNLAHQREDAAQIALAKSTRQPVKESPAHNDTNCSLHAQLHLSTLPVAWVPLLIALGLFVAFLTLLAPPLAPQPAFARLDCRGPPRR